MKTTKKKSTKALAIRNAAARCRKAFSLHQQATHAWCCHHEIFYEPLKEPAENRIKFILENKTESEQVTRLNNFRPVTNQKEFDLRVADYDAKRNALREDYDAKCNALREDYEAKRNALREDYEAKRKEAQSSLMELYRQDVKMGTWNGISIFK